MNIRDYNRKYPKRPRYEPGRILERPYYVVATEHNPGSFGVYNVFRTLPEAKQSQGHNHGDALIRFNDDDSLLTESVLFRWNEKKLDWEAVDAEEN